MFRDEARAVSKDHFVHGLCITGISFLVQWEIIKAFQRSDMVIVAVWKYCTGSSVENGLERVRLEAGI